MPSKIEDGNAHHPLYGRWCAAIQRCHNPNNKQYPGYGARGIRVCDSWRHNFRQFVKDMGPCPPGYCLDRANNDGNYEPNNCRWVTPSQSGVNRRARTDRETHYKKMWAAHKLSAAKKRSERTHFRCGHPFTEDNMYWSRTNGRNQSWCKTCVKAYNRARYHQRKAQQSA